PRRRRGTCMASSSRQRRGASTESRPRRSAPGSWPSARRMLAMRAEEPRRATRSSCIGRLRRLLVGTALVAGLGLTACAPSSAAPPPQSTAAAGGRSAESPAPPPASPTQAAPAATHVKLGLQNNATDIGYYLASERGYFAQEGLDVENVTFTNAS